MNYERKSTAMLLEFSCSNHKSIKDKITFSAIASNDDSNENLLLDYGNFRVLKNAVIYGANGSGKSNFISAVAYMKHLVVNSINNQPGSFIGQSPHKLLGLSNDSEYAIQFITKDVRYAYGFTLNNAEVTEEYLYYFPNGRQVKIFERTKGEFVAGDKFKGKFESCKDVLKPNRLFLSCAANFSSVKETENVYSFFNDELVIYSSRFRDNWLDYSLMKMNSDPRMKDLALTFLRGLGIEIKDINIDIKQEQLPPDVLPPFLSEEAKKEILKNAVNHIKASVVYDTFEVNLITEESTGIKKLFEIVCPLLDIIINGKVLICDELETNLHEAIVYRLVDLFRQLKSKNFPQMFFSTHDTSILNLNLFRRDQIWFTEMKKDERSTDLYSLSEIKNVRKDENVEKGYISGKYGAIPMLNESLATIIQRLQTEGENNVG